MLNMLKWLLYYKSVIREIILIGTLHIMPFIQNGQPFLDLAFKVNTPQVRRLIGKRESASDEFSRMVEREWSQFKWSRLPSERDSLKRRHEFLTDPTRDERCSVLYHLEEMEDLEDFFHILYQYRNISLIHLYEARQRLVFGLGKKSLIKVIDVSLDNMLQHKKSMVEEKEEFFIISYELIEYMNKSQLNLIFSTLDRLIILGKEKKKAEKGVVDILEVVTRRFSTDVRPNLRYTYNSTLQ